MIDEIKNPWHMRKGVVVFDIETDWGNDFSEEGKKSKVMRCGVLYSYDSDEFNTYYNPIELVDTLNKAKAIVSYNGEGFDFLVLEKYGLKFSLYFFTIFEYVFLASTSSKTDIIMLKSPSSS